MAHQEKHLVCLDKNITLIQVDEHLWKKNKANMESIIYNHIKKKKTNFIDNKIIIDARYDNAKKLIKEGYRVKLTKPKKFKVRGMTIYDAGRYIGIK